MVMRVDWQTLQDLGVLDPSGGQASVFDWLNRTRTQGGAQRLKERVRAPLCEATELRRTQDAVRFLAAHAAHLDPLLGGSAWLAVEHYRRSSFAALNHPNALFLWIDSWWTRWLQSDVYNEVRAGLALSQTLARAAASVMDSFSALDPPAWAAGWMDEVGDCLESPALARLIRGPEAHRARPPWLLGVDRLLRDDSFRPLVRLAALAYEIDSLTALARVTRDRELAFPLILDGPGPGAEGEGVFHPLLERAVGNPVRVSTEDRLIFLTGPNMAGKSTYLRAVGLAVLFAQLGMGVAAERFRLIPFQCMFSGINTSDNLRLGESYFFREVRRVREAAEILATGSSALMIFDEMFKGTNLKDASDACLAVLSRFAACEQSAFLVASHIAELAEPLEALPAVRFLQFGAELREGRPVFDFRAREGVSEQRLGMLILERERVLELLDRPSRGPHPKAADAAEPLG